MENQKKTLIISIIGIVAFVIAIAGISYAFFSYTVTTKGKDETNTVVRSANLSAKFTDGPTLDIKNLVPGDTISKTFSVENTGEGTLKFKVVINEVVNNFKSNDIKLKLYEGKGVTKSEMPIKELSYPTETAAISDELEITAKATKDYTLDIIYENTANDQSPDMKSSIGGKLYIEEVTK